MKRDPKNAMELRNGRSLVVTATAPDGNELLEIRSAGGELEIAIELSPGGARLKIRAIDVDIGAAQTLRMSCARAELHASDTIELRADKDIVMRAERGGMSLHANDDVDVKGERILLNADAQPMAASFDDFRSLVESNVRSAESEDR